MSFLRMVVVSACSAMLAGCVATRQETRFDRFDGRPISPVEFEQVKVECAGLGEQAALQVPRNYGGLMGAVDHGFNMGAARQAAERACLARNGIRATVVTITEEPSKPAAQTVSEPAAEPVDARPAVTEKAAPPKKSKAASKPRSLVPPKVEKGT